MPHIPLRDSVELVARWDRAQAILQPGCNVLEKLSPVDRWKVKEHHDTEQQAHAAAWAYALKRGLRQPWPRWSVRSQRY